MKRGTILKIICSTLSVNMLLTLGFTKNAFAVENETINNIKSNSYKYISSADVSLANQEKIIKMLKDEGKLKDNLSIEETQKEYNKYIANIYNKNSVEDKQKRTLDVNVNEDEQLEALRKRNALVIRVEFSDYKHNEIELEETDMYYEDYSTEHYENLLFSDSGYDGPNGENFISLKQYYKDQSGGDFNINGYVTPWYTLPNEAKYYGESTDESTDINGEKLVQDALNEVAKDKNIDLSQFDKLDLYDSDNDGILNEPDGIIDDIIIIHAGIGEEDGGGRLGSDAIWSHTGFSGGYEELLYKIPEADYYAGIYTMNPENTSVGTLAHEYAHTMGIPDEYDIFGNSGEAQIGEPIGCWSLMSQGVNNGKVIGSEPAPLSPLMRSLLQETYGGNWINTTYIDYKDLKYQGELYNIKQSNENRDCIWIQLEDPNKAYIIEWRNGVGIDKGLQNIAYYGGIKYDPGMVIWYLDMSKEDNNTSIHPGEGFLSIVDADTFNIENTLNKQHYCFMSSAFQMHDAAFSLKKGSTFKLDFDNGHAAEDKMAVANSRFIDYDYYSNDELPTVGVKLPQVGIDIKIMNQTDDNSSATLKIGRN